MNNYVDLGKNFSGRWEHYVFPDTEDKLFESLLERRDVSIVKYRTILRSKKTEYVLWHVMVKRKEEKQFLLSLEDLKNKMLICGYRDYLSMSELIIRDLEEMIRDKLREGKAVKLPSGKRARIDPARFLPERNGIRSDSCPAK